MISVRCAALTFAVLGMPSVVLADPPPKVCLAVAGDPDESVRTLARETEARLSSSSGWRVIADSSTREALRGESPTPSDQTDRAAARRSLRATDADASVLDAVGDALGCAWFVTLSSRSNGTAPRVYDVAHHRFVATPTATAFDAPAVVLLLEGVVNHPIVSSPPVVAAPSSPRPSPAAPARTAPAISRVWPWLVVGGVLLGVVGAVVLLQGDSTPRTNVAVVHRGIE